MLTQLTTVKARLTLAPLDTTFDALLTSAIAAISARFDQETNRTLARTVDATFEFGADVSELVVPCYPVESVTKFEIKTSEASGWLEQPGTEYLVLRGGVIRLAAPLENPRFATSNALPPAAARVTYTGGYLLPGNPDVASATRLPAELEHAAIEQTAFWFQTKDKLGVIRQWPTGGGYVQFADPDLLPSVRAILARHSRILM